MSVQSTSTVATSVEAVLPNELLGIVLAYHGPDPREMIVCTHTTHDMGMKMQHTTIGYAFDYPKIEQVCRAFFAIAAHFGCKKEVRQNISKAVQPTYAIIGDWYRHSPSMERRVTNLNLCDAIQYPIPVENTSLPRIRALFNEHQIVRSQEKETVIVDGKAELKTVYYRIQGL